MAEGNVNLAIGVTELGKPTGQYVVPPTNEANLVGMYEAHIKTCLGEIQDRESSLDQAKQRLVLLRAQQDLESARGDLRKARQELREARVEIEAARGDARHLLYKLEKSTNEIARLRSMIDGLRMVRR